MLKRYSIRDYHFRLVFYIVTLTIIGIMVIGSAQKSVQGRQILGLVLGLIVMAAVSLVDYTVILKFCWIFYFMDILLLLLVLVAGVERSGAKRWIVIAGIQFQPSELSKVIIILFFAMFFSKIREKINTIRALALSAVLGGIPMLLVLEEPDLSTTIVTAMIFISLLFIAGLSYKIVLGALAVCVPVSIVGIYMIMKGKILDGYQYVRIAAWLHPEDYPDSALQQQNSIMAVGSGQLWGKGLYNTDVTSVKNGNFISEPQTDFIFAVAGEEMGFIGAAAIIILLLLIALECLLIARKAKDLSGKLICCGMAALIAFQSFVNVCVVTGLMPNTGLPLPFVSYGLTSLVTLYMGMGIVLNVGLQPKKYGTGELT